MIKRGYIIAIILILALFTFGCTKQPNLTELPQQAQTIEQTEVQVPASDDTYCPYHYYQFRPGYCCLDANSNELCDSDEQNPIIPAYEQSSNADIVQVVTKLANYNIDVIDLAEGFDSINGNTMVLWLNAPGSEANNEELKTAFKEMYNTWGNKYNAYFIHVDNAKNRNAYRKRQVCTYGAEKITLRDAIIYNSNWDNVLKPLCWG